AALLALDPGDPGLPPHRSLGGPAPRCGRGRRALPRAARPGAGRGTVAGAVRPATVGTRALLSLRCGGDLPPESPRPHTAGAHLRRPAVGRHTVAPPAAVPRSRAARHGASRRCGRPRDGGVTEPPRAR